MGPYLIWMGDQKSVQFIGSILKVAFFSQYPGKSISAIRRAAINGQGLSERIQGSRVILRVDCGQPQAKAGSK